MPAVEANGPRSRALVKTGDPGIYKRGGAYCVVYRDPAGRQRKQGARTLAEARALKASLATDVRRGEWREQSAVTFAQHWEPWIDSYAGRTSRGFRANTREEYRRDLQQFALPHFGRMKLAAIEPADVKRWLMQLAAKGYAAGTLKNALAPVRAMLADAAEDGITRYNPAAGVRVPATARRPEARRKPLTPAELERLRTALRTDQDRLMVDFLVATGLRASEMLALDWADVNVGERKVRVRRRYYKGFDAPKSETSRRTVRVSETMAQRLLGLREARGAADTDPVFAGPTGARLDYSRAYNRVLQPAMRAAGITYGGFHRLRHTTGTELRRRGAALDEIQLHLGHHDLSFTRRVYVHMNADDGPDPALLDDLAGCAPAPRQLRAVST
jgi:integrase